MTNEVRYVYDGMLVIQERDGLNLPRVTYTRGPDLSGSLEGAGGIGGLLARTEHSGSGSSHSYYHADGNGNITALVDLAGNVLARYAYDPYGNLLGKSGPLADVNLYRFSSKELHPSSGLYYYGYRYYEPNLQRWVNRDPIQEAGGLNLFGFAFNNPTGLFDIDGRVVPVVVGIAVFYFSYEAWVNAPSPEDELYSPYQDAPDPLDVAEFCTGPSGWLAGALAENLPLRGGPEKLSVQDIPRGPKGGKKHTPGRDHQTKSGEKKKERFQKKAEKKREREKNDLTKSWDDWNKLTDEQRKMLPELKPQKPDPRCQ
jgi:RHS repeat-associated protein